MEIKFSMFLNSFYVISSFFDVLSFYIMSFLYFCFSMFCHSMFCHRPTISGFIRVREMSGKFKKIMVRELSGNFL